MAGEAGPRNCLCGAQTFAKDLVPLGSLGTTNRMISVETRGAQASQGSSRLADEIWAAWAREGKGKAHAALSLHLRNDMTERREIVTRVSEGIDSVRIIVGSAGANLRLKAASYS